MNKSSINNPRTLVLLIIVAVIVVLAIYVIRFQSIELGEDHKHARFKVYINTQQIAFNSEAKPQFHNVAEEIFLDGQNGHTIHRFTKTATLGDFFQSIGMKFTPSCFVLDEPYKEQTEFCNEGDKTLKFLLNGLPNDEYENYIIQAGDRFLITYGDQTERVVNAQMDSVSGVAYAP